MDKFLNPEEFNIDELFKGKYMIPIYQRPYSWTCNEVTQLLSDIDNIYNNYKNADPLHLDNDDSILFIGTLFIKTEKNVKNTYNEYDIVDGQQRITTLTLLLMVLLNRLYILNSEDESIKDLENYLWKKLDRKRNNSLRVLTLGNIDQAIMNELFDKLFYKENIIEFANKKLNEDIENVEKNLLSNLLTIDTHFNKFAEIDLYDYFEYIKYNIKFIAIKVHTKLSKLFTIFESINSKGKPLEDIDLIKSYIFQNINQDYYDRYLSKWGNLISLTNDNLMEYFTIYVRANISYYRTSIKLNNFKSLVENNFMAYFKTTTIQDTLIHLIDDLIENVRYYNMLKNPDLLEKIGVSKKSIVFFMMNSAIEYIHTKALFFKLIYLKNNNNLTEETFDRIIETAFKFILTFQSICNRESKNTLNVFVDVQNEIYNIITTYNDTKDLSNENLKNIEYLFYKKIQDEMIDNEALRNKIRTNINYNRNRKVTKNILSYLICSDNTDNIDYVKLYNLLKSGKDIHIDHILPLNPDKNDPNFSYYVNDNMMILKNNQDFIIGDDSHLLKDEFYDKYLHVLGNLRLEWSTENIKKSNKLISLEIFNEKFNTGTQISKRTTLLTNKLLSSNLLLSSSDLPKETYTIRQQNTVIIENFQSSMEYKGYEPIYFEILGEKYILDKYKFSSLLTKIMDIFYDLEKEEFAELANLKYSPTTSGRIYISNSAEDLRRYYSIDQNIFIETNLSSPNIIRFIFKLSQKLGFTNGDIKIALHSKN